MKIGKAKVKYRSSSAGVTACVPQKLVSKNIVWYQRAAAAGEQTEIR